MRKLKIIVLKRSILFLILTAFGLFLILIFLIIHFANYQANLFVDPKSGIIVIDPGHGGIDGGTNKDGILEKDINLDIAVKLNSELVRKGYTVIMTRDSDVALDNLDNSSTSRHQRDLNARANIINNSNAQLFVSIHVNCNLNKPSTDGSIVLYNDKFQQNKILAYSIQRSLNNITVNGNKRMVHDPVPAKYFLLSYSRVPGVIVETAFISNDMERHELLKDEFREKIAEAIAIGIEKYFTEQERVYRSGSSTNQQGHIP